MSDDCEAREERAMLAIAPHVFGLAPNGIERMKVRGIVNPSLPAESYACLERLVGLGYGGNPTEVAKFLILREIDDLKRAGVLKPTEAPNA